MSDSGAGPAVLRHELDPGADPASLVYTFGGVDAVVSIRPGTVSLPKGIWRRSTRNNATGTALVPDTLTDIGAGACFNDARVQVASLANA